MDEPDELLDPLNMPLFHASIRPSPCTCSVLLRSCGHVLQVLLNGRADTGSLQTDRPAARWRRPSRRGYSTLEGLTVVLVSHSMTQVESLAEVAGLLARRGEDRRGVGPPDGAQGEREPQCRLLLHAGELD